ncbi:glutamate receptor 3 plant, putative [Ricinus communis]|uniref:Glutamate receptor 3 plant, putative n=1 Tax=Ricinus communis TaxID=3988 RepID=B9S6W6_RICCO|nr:glutamate receptor 3 plant, putative [Ricinus communis]
MVDFTQPCIESGLVVVAPLRKPNSSARAFSRPFTPMMWFVTAAFFLVMGVVIWILEHRINDDFRGPPRRQMLNLLLFKSPEDYAKALKDGPERCGIAAVIDGQEFSRDGRRVFYNSLQAFPRDSPLSAEVSTAVLKLSGGRAAKNARQMASEKCLQIRRCDRSRQPEEDLRIPWHFKSS